jgi:hypothetical protein
MYLRDAFIPSRHCLFYVLCGYDTTFEQDFWRASELMKQGCLPFIMLYNNKVSPELRRFARWVNKRYYKVVPWEKFGVKTLV